MEQEPKKLDMEAAFREVASPPEVLENRRRSLKPLFQIYDLTGSGFLGNLLLALFSFLTACIAFVAVFRLTAWSLLALYFAITAAAVAGGLTAPLRYERLVARVLSLILVQPSSGLPVSEPPPPPSEVAEIRADLQREALRNRVIMRVVVFGYALCLWFLSVTDSEQFHAAHTLLLMIALATPVLLGLMLWLALGPLSRSS